MTHVTTRLFFTSSTTGKNQGDTIYSSSLIEHYQIPPTGIYEITGAARLTWLLILILPICWIRSASIEAARKKLQLKHGTRITVIDHFRHAWLALLPTKTSSMLILASHNVESHIYKQYALFYFRVRSIKALFYYWEYFKVRFWEGFVARKVDKVSVISSDDLITFKNLYGVHATLIEPKTKSSRGDFTYDPKNGALILGSFHWKAKQINLLDFLEKAYSKNDNTIALTIAGNMPEKFLMKLEKFIIQKRLCREVSILPNFTALSELKGKYNLGLLIDSIGGGFKLKAISYIELGIPFLTLRDSFPSNYQIDGAVSESERHLLGLSRDFLSSRSLSLELFNKQVNLFEDSGLISLNKGS